MNRYNSWGNYPSLKQEAIKLVWHTQGFPKQPNPLLPYGNGRSYGDSCLTKNGTLIDIRPLKHFIAFDRAFGVMRCEAGVFLSSILSFTVSKGWFLPVTPGTRFITVGGAIANDIHGKNHHLSGNFGNHVSKLELLRSDGTRLICSPDENSDWFEATIGGLGLTGIILWADIQMIPIKNPYVEVETIRFSSLEKFFELSQESQSFTYTVAWVDCLAKGRSLGRGIFMRGNHAAKNPKHKPSRPSKVNMPFTPPFSMVNNFSLKAFNNLYYLRPQKRHAIKHYEPFFYPLDSINHWNRLYGPRGFLQYQCVVPMVSSVEVMRTLLTKIAQAGKGSFLAVLKIFGDLPSRGWLSFPKPGATLALDFPFTGKELLELLDSLDEIVMAAGGAIYPAKDARMQSWVFKQAFPKWQKLEQYRDPALSSAFWERVTKGDNIA